MKITKITAQNFKGLNFDLELSAVNYLVGPNFIGKSARAEAIKLALLGYVPELGKTNAATFRLSSGREMSVRAELERGEIVRRWFLKGDSVKGEESVPMELFPESAEPVLATMLDAGTYFSLSERERVQYIANNVMGAHVTTGAVVVEEIMAGIVGKHSEPEFKDIIVEMRKRFTLHLDLGFAGKALPATEFLASALVAAKDMQSDAKALYVRWDKTVQGMMGLRAADAPGHNLAQLDARKREIEAQLQDLQAKKTRLSVLMDQGKQAKRQRDQLTAEVQGHSEIILKAEQTQAQLDDMELQLSRTDPVDAGRLQELTTELSGLDRAIAGSEAELRGLKGSQQANLSELATFSILDKCPYCEATGTGWKVVKTGEINAVLGGIKTKIQQLEDHIGVLKAGQTNSKRTHLQMVQEHDRRQRLVSDLNILKTTLEAHKGSLALSEQKREQLASLPADPADLTAEMGVVTTSLAQKTTDLNAIEGTRRMAIARDQEVQRMAQAEKGRDDATREQELATTAADWIREAQADAVAKIIEPLLEVANAVFGGVLPSPLGYNQETAEIGTWRGPRWVSHMTFSGTEKALCYASIQAALATKCPVRIMILDEMGRFDITIMRTVADRVQTAIDAGIIDQFVGIAPEMAQDALANNRCNVVRIQ